MVPGILSFLVVLYFVGNIFCNYNGSVPHAKVMEGKEVKWYYVPEFMLKNPREGAGTVLSIQCQSHALCGVKRNVDPATGATSTVTQYCKCPENEECRWIEVIEPANFTYYRCMDK